MKNSSDLGGCYPHKPPICKEGLKKLYESTAFGLNDPEKLQNKVFFEVMLYFCRPGRQNLRQLKKTDFSFNTDSTGARYVCKSTDELTKNQMQLRNIIGFGFRIIAIIIKASVCVIRLSLRLRQITQTLALIIIAIMLTNFPCITF